MSHKYSITPEGATEAAKEMRALYGTVIMEAPEYVPSIEEGAAIILHHAEQSLCQQARKTSESSSRTDVAPNQNADSRQARETVEQAGSSSEGEMREACIVCGCALMPPERTEPPHCMDCALTDEHYYAWEAGKGV